MSQKELKTKRKKLIWNDGFKSDWNKNPLVILGKALSTQSWFKGKIAFFGDLTNDVAEKEFKADKYDWPRELQVRQQHESVTVKVTVEWEFALARCEIYLRAPRTNKYYPSGSYNTPKTVKSRYVEGALERIKEAFIDAIPEAVVLQAARIEKEKREAEAKAFHTHLCEELGVELTKYKHHLHYYTYGKGRVYTMSFQRDTKDKDSFTIDYITGDFGKEEIKQVIKLVGGNPRAIASRLTGKKR